MVDDMPTGTPAPAPTVTVLLCVRNGAALLEHQLAALAAQDYEQPWELVLVDNGSTDGTRAVAERWLGRLPELHIVEEPQAGLNRARNRGLASARARLVACCDADDEVASTWLAAMVAALRTFDVVGGELETHRLNARRATRDAVPQRRELPTVFDRPYAMGANLGFRMAVWERIGGFDEMFTLGSDDTDFCLRAQYAGCSIGFAPEAVIHYRVRNSARSVTRQRFAYGRGHQQLVRKHAAMGEIQSRLLQRWKVIAVGLGVLARRTPLLFDPYERLQFLASAAYLAGRSVELAKETTAAIRG